jgi:hypothetical protein
MGRATATSTQPIGEPVTRAAVYDLEQGIQEQLAEEFLTAALERSPQPAAGR